MTRSLSITKLQLQELLDHAKACAPLEACGLMAGNNSSVEKIILVGNQAQSPARFVMDPHEQLHAFEWMDANALDLLAIFHSHPAGPETPSATDILEAAYAVVQVIAARVDAQWRARGFWIERGAFEEVILHVK